MREGKHLLSPREATNFSLDTPVEDHCRLKEYVGAEARAGLIETFDIEKHASFVSPFDVRRNQISAGRFYSKLSYVKMRGMVVYEDRWLRRAESFGASPEGYIVILMNVAWQRSRIDWCGRKIDHRQFAYSAPGSEINYRAQDNSHYAILLVEPEILAGILGAETVDLISHRKHLECSVVGGKQLIVTLTWIIQHYMMHPELLEDACEIDLIQSWLSDSLRNCFIRGESNERHEPGSFRGQAMSRAIEHLACQSGPVTAQELAVASGASQRTLEYGFRKKFGMTPGVYLRIHRLNRAHHDLSLADPHLMTITKIAQNWGFFHPGRFSVEYRQLFGTMPSKTLARPQSSTQLCPLKPLSLY
jgi:AraC-like DNA-binding protein